MVRTKTKKRVISIVSSMLLGLNLLLPSVSFANSTDIDGHWAKSQIQKWTEKGLVKGYADGSFKPNAPVTRAEFVSFINRLLDYTEQAEIQYSDVKADAWYAGEIAAAVKKGYIKGYEDGTIRPNQQITRQESATMIARLASLQLGESDAQKVLSQFKDQKDIAQWSKGAVGAVVSKELMNGYPDQTYRPGKAITRAEAVVTLDNMVSKLKVSVTYGQAGTFGSLDKTTTIDGNVYITSPNVTLQNYVINGDLIIHENVGNGDVNLEKVTVKGTTIVRGGGSNSVHVKDSTLDTMNVNKKYGDVRVEASGSTTVKKVNLESGAKLEEKNLTGTGFTDVTVVESVPSYTTIELIGSFDTLQINAPKTIAKLSDGIFQTVQVTGKAEDSRIDLAEKTTIKNLTLDAASTVRGKGKVEVANINVNGSKFEKHPEKVNMPEGVTYSRLTAGGGGGGGGGQTPAEKTNEQKQQDLLAGRNVEGSVTLDKDSETYGGTGSSNIATVSGSVTVSGEDIILQNVIIKGDLIISKEVAPGVDLEEFTANNVEVQGDTLIGGGSSHTVVFSNAQLGHVEVNKQNVRVALSGNTSVRQIAVNGQSILDLNTTGNLGDIEINDSIDIQGTGNITGSITINKRDVEINISSDKVKIHKNITVNVPGVIFRVPENGYLNIDTKPGVTPPTTIETPVYVMEAILAVNALPSVEKLKVSDKTLLEKTRNLLDAAISKEELKADSPHLAKLKALDKLLLALENQLLVLEEALKAPIIESISFGNQVVTADKGTFKINLKDITNRISANLTVSKKSTLDLQFGNMSIKGIGVQSGVNKFSNIDFGNVDISDLNEANVDLASIFKTLRDSNANKEALYDAANLEGVFEIIQDSNITKAQILTAIDEDKLATAIEGSNLSLADILDAVSKSEYSELFKKLRKESPETKAKVLNSIKFDELFAIIDGSDVDRVEIVKAIDLKQILQLIDDADDIGLTVFEILAAMDGDNSDLLTIKATLKDDNNHQTSYTIQMQF